MGNNKGSNLTVASLFIIGGLILLANNFGFFDTDLAKIIISWPVLVIAIGFLVLSKENYTLGLFTISVGILFLIPRIFDVPYNWIKTVWPVVFVLVGMIMLFRQSNFSKIMSDNSKDEDNDCFTEGYVSIKNSCNNITRIVKDKNFNGSDITNNFGKVVLDISAANLINDETTITLDCSFGTIELLVPPYLQVVFDISQNLSDCQDKRLIPVFDQAYCKKIVIKGNVSFGSVLIK